ncbi:MAG TPA: tRNA (N6-isopentenyl adenosine(37)-C2)-methylthiotransferase MiaB [Syntrophomonas sp.]|nr:tRNA (N6-isopentenyl adenosine(37)-C2)-methylthiotransferase MiaB [Syntrophomonas sp.]HRW12503.1 tRNA (N6-isopentenyl adenosine(37)-C2)-methylthiotransferase MiaB [Syntrophomonas sp.]
MKHDQAPPRGYHILTYGCQMNSRDSEIISGLLEQAGYCEVPLEAADLVVFNTCSVRHSAENKVYGKLGEVNKIKRSKPGLRIAFGGCMAQLPEVVKRLKRQGVDVVFGTHNLHQLPILLERIDAGEKSVIEVWEQHGEIIEDLPSKRKKSVSAFVNIMYGCNNFCSYCIVPYTRGRERSRKARDIIWELEKMVGEGVKEVTLLGQNVNSYGQGGDESLDFASLLQMADKVEGLQRIRFMTSHPKDMSDALIDTIAAGEKLCEHIHVPLQAGSNQVLKRMNRGYTRESYLELINKMRARIPGVAITSDLIVGFPGESEADFDDTLEMVERVRFDAAFTFMYSVRTGTRAASFNDQIELAVKQNRLLRLNQQQYDIALQKNQALEGRVMEILVDGPSKTNPDRLTGRTRTNLIVIFSGPNDLIGQLINVKITTGKTFSVFGELPAETS